MSRVDVSILYFNFGVKAVKPSYTNFDEFYVDYLLEHRKPVNRALHLFGTLSSVAWITTVVSFRLGPMFWLLALVIGYGPSWVGHFFIEKNRPATFRYPLKSLMGDFRMAFDILRNRRLLFEKSS